MAKQSLKIDLLLKKADKYFRKAQRRYYISKWAEESGLLARLNDIDVINETLSEQLEELTEHYGSFLEEAGVHKLHKDKLKLGYLQHKLLETLNEISTNSYINKEENPDAFFDENDEFDGDTFLDLLADINKDIMKRLDRLGDIPDYDPAHEAKQKIIQLLRGIEKDEDYKTLVKSQNVNNTVAYLKQNYPEVAEAIKEVHESSELKGNDWKDIMEDLSNIVAAPYQQQGGRIIDTQKQRDAKAIWVINNPLRVFEQRKRDYANYKKKLVDDPAFKEKEDTRKDNYRVKYIAGLKAKVDKGDLAAQKILNKYPDRFRKMRGAIPGEKEETGKGTEISRFFIDEIGMQRDLLSEWRTFSPADKIKYQNQYDALIAQHEKIKEPTYNIQTLRNKFVVIPARTERLRLIKDRLENDNSDAWQRLKEEFSVTKNEKPLMKEIMKDPEYLQFVAQMPQMLKQDKSTRTFREFQRLPLNIQDKILEGTQNLRTY